MPTVAEVLALDVLQRGLPEVVAGRDGLDREVRWVHISEVPDVAHLLRGGEIVLTTGIALPTERDALVQLISELSGASAAGVIVELGRRFSRSLPAAAITVANRMGLPLVELHREVPFVSITEAAHSLIFESQLADLRTADRINDTFLELSLEGASTSEILSRVARLTKQIVVLENLAHQPLAIDTAGLDANDLLLTWNDNARRVVMTGDTTFHAESGWLVAPVGARGQVWGRLVLACQQQPRPVDIMAIQKASAALALNHLIDRDSSSEVRLAHGSLLVDILTHARPVSDTAVAAAALGVHLDRGCMVGLVIRLAETVNASKNQAVQLADLVARVAESCKMRVITGRISDHSVGMLLSLDGHQQPDAVISSYVRMLRKRNSLAGRGTAEADFIVAVGPVVAGAMQARRTLQEATMMAHAVIDEPPARPWHSIKQLELRGLFRLLQSDPTLTAFIEARLGPLLAYEATHPDSRLVDVLRSFLRNGANKSLTAQDSHLSRPILYRRLALIQRITDVDLDEPDSRLSLHAALVAYEAQSSQPLRSAGRGTAAALMCQQSR